MLSKEQVEIKMTKIKIVIECFLEEPKRNTYEVSKITGISQSSVQRYLQDELVSQCWGLEITGKIKKQLERNKISGTIKGGNNSINNNILMKDAKGKFLGVSKVKSSDKTNENDIEHMVNIIANDIIYYNYTNLEEAAFKFNISVEEIIVICNEILPLIDKGNLYELLCKKYHIDELYYQRDEIKRK